MNGLKLLLALGGGYLQSQKAEKQRSAEQKRQDAAAQKDEDFRQAQLTLLRDRFGLEKKVADAEALRLNPDRTVVGSGGYWEADDEKRSLQQKQEAEDAAQAKRLAEGTASMRDVFSYATGGRRTLDRMNTLEGINVPAASTVEQAALRSMAAGTPSAGQEPPPSRATFAPPLLNQIAQRAVAGTRERPAMPEPRTLTPLDRATREQMIAAAAGEGIAFDGDKFSWKAPEPETAADKAKRLQTEAQTKLANAQAKNAGSEEKQIDAVTAGILLDNAAKKMDNEVLGSEQMMGSLDTLTKIVARVADPATAYEALRERSVKNGRLDLANIYAGLGHNARQQAKDIQEAILPPLLSRAGVAPAPALTPTPAPTKPAAAPVTKPAAKPAPAKTSSGGGTRTHRRASGRSVSRTVAAKPAATAKPVARPTTAKPAPAKKTVAAKPTGPQPIMPAPGEKTTKVYHQAGGRGFRSKTLAGLDVYGNTSFRSPKEVQAVHTKLSTDIRSAKYSGAMTPKQADQALARLNNTTIAKQKKFAQARGGGGAGGHVTIPRR